MCFKISHMKPFADSLGFSKTNQEVKLTQSNLGHYSLEMGQEG